VFVVYGAAYGLTINNYRRSSSRPSLPFLQRQGWLARAAKLVVFACLGSLSETALVTRFSLIAFRLIDFWADLSRNAQ